MAVQPSSKWSDPVAIDDSRKGYYRYRTVTSDEAWWLQRTTSDTVTLVDGVGWVHYKLQDSRSVLYEPQAVIYESTKEIWDSKPEPELTQGANIALAQTPYVTDSSAAMTLQEYQAAASKRASSASTASSHSTERSGKTEYILQEITSSRSGRHGSKSRRTVYRYEPKYEYAQKYTADTGRSRVRTEKHEQGGSWRRYHS